ncbi:retrovirus-related pol polyprotein from transposon TNT 1-94 [Tanacetum coccineum]|uniref:Retrovirus-related pol polyprotein from transposon TNT 1-94 n=1 Tax=Tanacetum coccineum TaxID=301880 RepID=A0ABQ5J5Y1_9ASTR
MSTARTLEQNDVVERQNRTLVEAARTMLSAAKVPLYFWAEAIATIYGENLDKMKGKGDACIFVGYSTQSRAYRGKKKTTIVVSKSSVVTATDAPNQRQQQNTTQSTSTTIAADIPPLNIQTTPETTNQALTQAPTQVPTVTDNENIIQAETNKEYAQVNEDEFINIFCTPNKSFEIPSHQLKQDFHLETVARCVKFADSPWLSKKQDCTSMSSQIAEYVSIFMCLRSSIYVRTQLTDYDFHFDKIPMYCDSKAAIAISCNPIQHSHTKHIDVRYHFIKEQVENVIVELFFVRTEYQLTNLFTKALPEDRFKYLVRRLGMRCLTPEELKVLANESA